MRHPLLSMTQQGSGLPISLISAEQAKSTPKGRHFYPINLIRLFVVLLLLMVSLPCLASDHGDVPMGNMTPEELKITDFISFVDKGNLIMILATNPMLPTMLTNLDYQFPENASFNFYIDTDPPVAFDISDDNNKRFGGTITDSTMIKEEVHISVTFNASGEESVDVTLDTMSIDISTDKEHFYAGVRDDPFSNPRRHGENVVAIAISLPLNTPDLTADSPILLWANVIIEDGSIREHAGLAFRSMFNEDLDSQEFNTLRPSNHLEGDLAGKQQADVMIYRPMMTSKTTKIPNGRALKDDTLTLLCYAGDKRVCQLIGEIVSEPSRRADAMRYKPKGAELTRMLKEFAADSQSCYGSSAEDACQRIGEIISSISQISEIYRERIAEIFSLQNDEEFLDIFPYLAEPH